MNSVEIRTLLRTGEGDFVPIERVEGRVKWSSVNGAIELSIDGKPIITTKEWDDVRDLWLYIVGIVELLYSGAKEARIYFPDQPISFVLSRKGHGQIEVLCDTGRERRSAVTAENDILSALCAGGISFFDALVRLGAREAEYRNGLTILENCLNSMRSQ
jgi:hypothetical protein